MSTKENSNRSYLPFLIACAIALGVLLGVNLTKSSGNASAADHEGKIHDIMELIEEKYVDTVNEERLTEGLIDEVLGKLDPHSYYFPPRDADDVNENLQGNFEGIGIEFFIVDDTIRVVSPISGGPSEALGIMAGDKITHINDSTVAGIGITNNDVIAKLRGPKGSQVKVKVKRAGYTESIDYDITRDKIPLYSLDVSYLLNEETGYIKINRFSASTYDEFGRALQTLKQKGAISLVLDLRQNPGGYLTGATMMADEFIDGKKLLVYTEGKAYSKRNYKAGKPGLFEEGKLVILIDQGSASASEIVAGAVQDWDRGTIIGRRSFGKGLVQEQYDLEDGSMLRLTVARYFTPSGRCIQKPYEDGNEAYYSEIYDRYDNGEYLNKDSIKLNDSLTYFTAGGRKVFGGGGIVPDIFVPLDTLTNYELFSKLRRYIPEFVYKKSGESSEFLGGLSDLDEFVQRYEVSSALYGEYMDYVQSKKVRIDGLETAKLETRLKNTLKAYIAKQKWQNAGYYPVIHQGDEYLKAAMAELEKE